MNFKSVGQDIAGVVAGIFALAIVAVVLSNSANTSGVITSFFSGLTSVLGAVLTPVTGGSSVLNQTTGTNLLGAIGGTNALGSVSNVVPSLNSLETQISSFTNGSTALGGSVASVGANPFAGFGLAGGDGTVPGDTFAFDGTDTGAALGDAASVFTF